MAKNTDISFKTNSPRLSLNGKKENLQDLVNKYKQLQNPTYCKSKMIEFTLKQDLKLYNRLKGTGTPKDTGLLEKSWVKPCSLNSQGGVQSTPGTRSYAGSLLSGTYNVYVLNTATIGEQQKLKYAKEGWGHFKKRKVRGSYKLKRYLKYVDKQNEFYTRQLRNIRQGINKEWKEFVNEDLLYGVGVFT